MDFIELFAGVANTTKMARYSHLKSAKFDVLYEAGKKKSHKSDFMNILHSSGFLFFFYILHCLVVPNFSLVHKLFFTCLLPNISRLSCVSGWPASGS